MSARIKGWCPSAHRPMMSGDGLLVRVRPRMARLPARAVQELCDLARRYGNGMIDLTSRANLQIRGVTEAGHPALLADLIAAGLVDADASREARRATVTPFWRAGDLTDRLGAALSGISLPDLPDKMGIVIDTGTAQMMSDTPGDFRFETAGHGALILRADGADRGWEIAENEAGAALAEMVRWFLNSGGAQSGRMARHMKTTALPEAWQTTLPGAKAEKPTPGDGPDGHVFGVPFGQTDADALETLVTATQATGLRVTPWRLLLAEEAKAADIPGFVSEPHLLLNVSACPGAPACAQSTVATRDLARKLAPLVQGTLHVSGCAKGCARRSAADVTLVGQGGRFDLVKDGRPGDTPDQSGLSETDVLNLMARANAL